MKFQPPTIALLAIVAIMAAPVASGAQQPAAPKQSASAAATSPPSASPSAAGESANAGEQAPTPAQRAFAEKFIKTVQARDLAGMKDLIPPTTLKCFAEGKQKFLDHWIKEQFNYQIPVEHRISVSKIPPDMSKPTKMATYPVPRTDLMEFEYASATSIVTVTQEIGQEGGKWYAIPPCPTGVRMMIFVNKEKEREIARERAEHAYAQLKDPLKSQLLAMIAKSDFAGATRLCVRSLKVDPATAQALVAKLAGDTTD